MRIKRSRQEDLGDFTPERVRSLNVLLKKQVEVSH